MKTQTAHVRSRVSEILHKHIIDRPNDDTPTVKALEQTTETPLPTIYKVLSGERRFTMTIEEFPKFYRTYGRPIELLRWIVGKCEPTKRMIDIGNAAQLNGTVSDENENIVMKSAEAIRGNRIARIDKNWSDERIQVQEDIYLGIISEATTAIQELERFRKETTHDVI